MSPMRRVWTFFYGSYINFDVLGEVDLLPEEHEVAVLHGYDLRIRPLANIVRRDETNVYGIVATATHAELDRLYREHALGVLGGSYLPEAVLVETQNGASRPALCYIAHEMEDRPADPAYVERIAGPARRFGFPDWYVRKIEAFKG